MAEISLKLKPWTPPIYALVERPPGKREDGFREAPSVHVKDLPEDALHALAHEWLVELYRKTGRPMPWILK